MRIALVRGKHLNQGEMDNYATLVKKHDITAISSMHPLSTDVPFPVQKFISPVDLPDQLFLTNRYKMAILNRLWGDATILFGLEHYFEWMKKVGKKIHIAHPAETYTYYTQQCIRAKRQRSIDVIITTVWENIPFNHEGIRNRKKFKQLTIKYTDHFLAVTNQAKDVLIQEGCNEDKISVIPMGVDLSKFFPTEPKSSCKKLLFVGRLEKEKGVWELLEAFSQLHKIYTDLDLTLCGSGSQERAIQQYCFNHNLTKVITLQNINYPIIQDEYRNHDLFILPSKPTQYWQEQYGMVLVEAMACGLPIITTTCGAIPEVVGDSALLVPHSNAPKLYGALKTMIDQPLLRRQYRMRSLDRVKKYYNSKFVADKINDVYMNCINRRKL